MFFRNISGFDKIDIFCFSSFTETYFQLFCLREDNQVDSNETFLLKVFCEVRNNFFCTSKDSDNKFRDCAKSCLKYLKIFILKTKKIAMFLCELSEDFLSSFPFLNITNNKWHFMRQHFVFCLFSSFVLCNIRDICCIFLQTYFRWWFGCFRIKTR